MNRRKASIGSAIAGLMVCFVGPGLWASETDAVTGASPHAGGDSQAAWSARHDQFSETMTQRADELGLSAQQRADLQAIATDYGTRFRDLAQIGRDTARNLMQIAPDAPEYRDKTQEASALAASSAAELVVLLAEMRSLLYAVLTAEQREQLKTMLQSHHDEEDQSAG